MSRIKKGTKISNAGYVKDVKEDKGAVTMTIGPEKPEPDWKEIAYSLFNIVDDIALYFENKPEEFQRTPDFRFLQKKVFAAHEHFINDRGRIISRHEKEIRERKFDEVFARVRSNDNK